MDHPYCHQPTSISTANPNSQAPKLAARLQRYARPVFVSRGGMNHNAAIMTRRRSLIG
jgi:hypothetical protein